MDYLSFVRNIFDGEAIHSIYEDIYLKQPDFSINVFLCGAETKATKSIRTILGEEIDKNSRFNVVYPEWLFSSIVGKLNLLDLEQQLADTVDIIILPIEGLGAIAELGSFATKKELINKIIVINDAKYALSRSFINIGPIALIKKEKKSNLILINRDDNGEIIDKEEFVNKILNKLKKVPGSDKTSLTNLFNLSRFLLFLIGIYQPINLNDIVKLLGSFGEGKRVDIELLKPALDILFKKHMIIQELKDDKYVFKLSNEGHLLIHENILPKLGVVRKYSRIRAHRINSYYRKKHKFDPQVGVDKFLEKLNA